MLHREIIYKQGYERLLKAHKVISTSPNHELRWTAVYMFCILKTEWIFFKKTELPSPVVQNGKTIRRHSDRMKHANICLPANDCILLALISLELKSLCLRHKRW